MSLANQLSREDMLRELELLPVWQLRQPLPAQLKTAVSSADAGQPEVSKHEPTQPDVAATESAVAELPVIETQSAAYAALELAEPLPVEVEPPKPAPVFATVLQPSAIEAAASFDALVPEPAQEAVPEQVQALPLRLLLSEANVYAFLIAPYAAELDAEPVETLLRNMMRAMQLDSRVDITDSVDKLLAAYVPKVIISFGAEPANQLFGTMRRIEDWRTAQQQMPLAYEGVPLLVTHHPAHLLEHSADKADAWRDLCSAMKLIQRL
ncbi:hypothetical protein [Methylotenera sp. G11]|uniref:hypothetical protein n=1 Tax=Methylotenera sp. G11 TaxID=1506585 RepID=UPI00068F090F|nr:hypothetical protein [Methylotenera sp. G11]